MILYSDLINALHCDSITAPKMSGKQVHGGPQLVTRCACS